MLRFVGNLNKHHEFALERWPQNFFVEEWLQAGGIMQKCFHTNDENVLAYFKLQSIRRLIS